jgi:hypothetical protein
MTGRRGPEAAGETSLRRVFERILTKTEPASCRLLAVRAAEVEPWAIFGTGAGRAVGRTGVGILRRHVRLLGAGALTDLVHRDFLIGYVEQCSLGMASAESRIDVVTLRGQWARTFSRG